jgi:hypothetical protein
LVKMKETAKALLSKNKNEQSAARTVDVSLDRADNVIEGGPPFFLLHRTALSSQSNTTRVRPRGGTILPLQFGLRGWGALPFRF